jgi:glycosyltransferase involved in cell wall biosynthesis
MTAKHQNRTGRVEATVFEGPEPSFAGVDIVHGFGLSRADIRQAREARLPVVISPIYWGKEYVLRGAPTRGVDYLQRLRAGAVLAIAAARGRHHDKAEAYLRRLIEATASYESADLLLPNSESEGEAIRRDLYVTTPQWVVPNGVEPDLFTGAPPEGRTGVLVVGRVEPHKNQLALIRALRGTGIQVTIVGDPHPDHEQYYARCLHEGRGQVVFHAAVPHDELPRLYARARVHALPSFFETTGLVSLEAGLMGCNLVSTSRGFARDYLHDLARYCEPDDIRSIRAAVTEAYDAPFDPRLRELILGNYTWTKAAQATEAAYADLLARPVRIAE